MAREREGIDLLDTGKVLGNAASTSVPHPSTSKEDFRVWHKRDGKLVISYLTGPNSCLYRYSLTLNGREKEERY